MRTIKLNERLVSAIAYQTAFRPDMAARALADLNRLLAEKKRPDFNSLAILVRVHAYWLELPFPFQGDRRAWHSIHQLQGRGCFNGARTSATIITRITRALAPDTQFIEGIMPPVLLRAQELHEKILPADSPLITAAE